MLLVLLMALLVYLLELLPLLLPLLWGFPSVFMATASRLAGLAVAGLIVCAEVRTCVGLFSWVRTLMRVYVEKLTIYTLANERSSLLYASSFGAITTRNHPEKRCVCEDGLDGGVSQLWSRRVGIIGHALDRSQARCSPLSYRLRCQRPPPPPHPHFAFARAQQGR